MALSVTLLTDGTGVSGSPIATANFNIAANGTLVIALGWEEGVTISSALLDNATAASGIVQRVNADGDANAGVVYWLNVSSGNTRHLDITFSGAVAYANYQVYLISGWTTTPETSTSTTNAGTIRDVTSGALDPTQTQSARVASVGNFDGDAYTTPAFGGSAAHGPYPTGNYYATWYDTWDGSDPGSIEAQITQANNDHSWACVQVLFEVGTGGTDVDVTAGCPSLTLTKNNTTVNATKNIQAGLDSLTITPLNAAINVGIGIVANLVQLTITENAAQISADINVVATCPSLSITPCNATISTVPNHDYTTTFPLTENPISEGDIWLTGLTDGIDFGDVETYSGMAHGVARTGTYNDPIAILKGEWDADQSVEITAYVNSPSCDWPEIEIRLRNAISANTNTGYEVCYSVKSEAGYVTIARWDGGTGEVTEFEIVAGVRAQNGDVLKGTIVGYTITGYINDVQVIQWTDDTAGKIATGAPGFGFNYGMGDDYANVGITEFAATDHEVDVNATCANLTLTPLNATVQADIGVTAGVVDLTVTPLNATLNVETNVSATCPSLTLTKNNATLNVATNVSAYIVALTVTALNASVSIGANISADCASLTVTPNNATLNIAQNISAGCAALTVTTLNATVETAEPVEVTAACASLTLTTLNADVNLNVNVDADTDTLLLSALNATINAALNIQANATVMNLVAYNATVTTTSWKKYAGVDAISGRPVFMVIKEV